MAIWVVRAKAGEAHPREDAEEPTAAPEGEIISFARWILPSPDDKEQEDGDGDGYEEPPWILPEGTRWGVLNRWTELVERALERELGGGGGRRCYREFAPFFFFLLLLSVFSSFKFFISASFLR